MAVRGARQLRRRLRAIRREAENPRTSAIARELEAQAVELLGRSQAIAPELTRELIKGALIVRRDTRGRFIRVIAYTAPYAIIRHEDFYRPGPITAAKAGTQDGPPGRKYLERPYNNMRAQIPLEVGRVIERTARRLR